AKRLRRLEVDDQLELRGLLDRKVGWLRSFQDSINIAGSTPKVVRIARTVGEKAASQRLLSQTRRLPANGARGRSQRFSDDGGTLRGSTARRARPGGPE